MSIVNGGLIACSVLFYGHFDFEDFERAKRRAEGIVPYGYHVDTRIMGGFREISNP
jgi:hypothetical protein